MLSTLLVYLAVGATAGVLAGLFGVGGGLIMVPALAWLLPAQGVSPAITMQVAIATSLAVISATSISSMLAHHRRGGVLWTTFRSFAPGLALGAIAGAFVADALHSDTLKHIVGAGAVLVSIQMFLNIKPAGQGRMPPPAGLAAGGGIIGLLSSLIGIGGGSLTVPFLSWCGVEMRQAVGTSAASGVPIAWAGAIGFIITGWGVSGRPPMSLGYIALPGFAGIAIASVMTAPLGARLAHTLPPKLLKRSFAGLLAVIGIKMLFS